MAQDLFLIALMLVFWLALASPAWIVGHMRGHPVAGLIWGLLLGPLGCLVVGFMPVKAK